MAARRLVLNGLTAEVGASGCGDGGARGGSPDSLEFYHELELYRQLLALPPESGGGVPPTGRAQRRARTPDPTPSIRCHDEPRRSRTPCGACTAVHGAPLPAHDPVLSAPPSTVRHARTPHYWWQVHQAWLLCGRRHLVQLAPPPAPAPAPPLPVLGASSARLHVP